MVPYILNAFLFRIVLPISISTCVIFRPSVLSAIYLTLLCYLPFVPVPTEGTMRGHTGIFLKLLVGLSVVTTLGHAAFQVTLVSMPPYAHFLKSDPFLEKLLRHMGLVRLDALSYRDVIVWLSPEVLMLVISVAFLVTLRKLTAPPPVTLAVEEPSNGGADTKSTSAKEKRKQNYGLFVIVGRFCVLFALCTAAVLRPSVPGGLYFLVFLCTATWWAGCKQLRKGFAVLMICLAPIVAAHLFCMYAYQLQWTQELLRNDTDYTRLFGLTPIYNQTVYGSSAGVSTGLALTNTTTEEINSTNVIQDITDPRVFVYSDVEWAVFLNPIAIYVLFYLLILEAKELLKPELQKKQGPFSRLEGGSLTRHVSTRLSARSAVPSLGRRPTTRNRWQSATRKVRDVVLSKPVPEPNERTPLIRGVSPSKRHGSGKRSGIFQDSTGSVTVTGDNTEDIPLDELGTTEDEYQPTVLENVFYAMESIAQLIIRSSYIGTNIIMMAWSITYLSWLTFILLIWANLIWLVPNQRKSMLRSSPFLVLYAWFLLISAYIYSMDVDLPSTFEGLDLAEIGFVKVTHLPCAPLFVKCLYTVMFWVTLRQYIQERAEERHSSALADMAAPLQITVGAASAGTNRNNAAGAEGQEKTGSKVMERIGQHLKRFLTKFWIWVVAITLFAVAITGQRMTGFRILYMALFLIFILSFQFSFQVWRKMMFGFWLTVIIYSMIILVMVYTYQFKNFPKYWTEYLRIPEEQQLDIGLEQFETTQLFVRLVTPTFFVIITVIQLHYFHNDFMALSDPKNAGNQVDAVTDDLEQSSMQGGAYVDKSEKEEPSSQIQFDFYDLDKLTSAQFQLLLRQWLKRLHRAKNLCYLFLELHMTKAVLLFAMLMCVYDKCALYFVIVVLISLALTFGRPMQTFAIYFSSLLVSIMLLARMIYQIQYITPQNWDVNCTVTENPDLNMTTKNNAPWFGFEKGSSLPGLVKWNIIYILVVTLWAVILVRQYNYRLSRGRPTTRAFFMFPNIKRKDADTNLRNYLKYLANYGYYKFGVEISLMMTVAVIGTRMDMYSVLYAVWLCILFSMKRSTLSKVWLFYLIFLAVALPLQYFMAVGLPPTLCQEFPWDRKDQLLHSLQDWAYLLDNYHPPPVKKLILDFVLLLLVSRQWVVFRIEKRYARAEYAGGSNEVIIHLAEEKDFKNPVPDFITYARSYLDIFKRAVLQSFLWITLAIVFLAGTNRTNIFSLGYLVGAFVFLWHGSDFYLKPIPTILKQWQWLLGYNVSVIFIKTAFQILGCIFIHDIPTNCCWLVQLLGIGCVRKFGANLVEPSDAPGAVPLGQTEYCTVPREFIGIAWDGLCFGLLIMQRRIFHSYNFFHIVDECKATTILASRGAELIEEIRQKMVHNQEEQEHRVLEKIKMKMDRIKANQQKLQASSERGAPLAHSTSTASCSTASPGAGYHTPVEDDEDEGEEEDEEEEDAPLPTASSQITSSAGGQQAPPSPYSAVMTVSLEGYLEPQRLSFSSPPNSELNPRPASPDDSFPVFSPPPYNHAPSDILVPPTAGGRTVANPVPPYSAMGAASTVTIDRRRDSIGPPWMPQNTYQTPRQSVISYSSRSPLSHHEYSVKGKRKYRIKPPVTNKQAIRSGDYYMFDDLDDDEIDLLTEEQAIDEEDKKKGINKPDIGELLSIAMKSDMSAAIHKHSQAASQHQQRGLHRQYSAPLSRKRSTRSSTRSQLSAAFSAPPTIDEHDVRSVRIQEEPETEDEPQPGTSKDEDISELTESKDTIGRRILQMLLFIWAFVESSMISLTNFLNKYSRDYRYVLKVLSKEKKILKEKTAYNVGLRIGPGQMWHPAGSYHSLLRQSIDLSPELSESTGRIFSPSDSYRYSSTMKRATSQHLTSDEKPPASDDSDTRALGTSLPYSSEYDRKTSPTHSIIHPEVEELSQYDQPTIVRLLLAMWYIVMSRSEILCYSVIFLNQMKTSTLITLPLPMMVFFWGSLTIPRPSKTFWVTIIAYTEAIVLLKCIFQFDILQGGSSVMSNVDAGPLMPTKLLGLYRKEAYAMWDLLLLLVVFFHRVMLKSLGIWTTSPPTTVAILSGGEYRLEDGHLIPIGNSSPKTESDDTHDDTANSTAKSRNGSKSSSGRSSPGGEIVSIDVKKEVPFRYYSKTVQLGFARYGDGFKTWLHQLLDPTSRVAADVYSLMFLCDFINFFVILFGYSSFGAQQDGGVSSYLEDNRVPVLFLFMLILQFMLIVIDRGIYLRKNILAKIIFQFLQIILLHIWLFIVFPVITGSKCNTVLPPQIYYMVKCFYLLLSAYQIRCGYPTRILGNFLCKGYGYVNMFCFRGFMLVPFLFELRTCMDWMWTETSMTVFDWIKMEDIFAHIFLLKCQRHAEDEFPQPRGEKKNSLPKYLMGGGILAVIIGIIWFPLVFFSLGNAVGETNVPYDVTLEIRIGPYEPIYRMSAQSNSIYSFKPEQLDQLRIVYNNFKSSGTFINNYEAADIAAVKLSIDSGNIWGISPPDRKRMVAEINSTNPVQVRLDYKISHQTSKPEDTGIIRKGIAITLPAETEGRANLLKMLEGLPADPVLLQYLLPKFIKVTNRGTVEPVEELMLPQPDEKAASLRNITTNLNKTGAEEWWRIREECNDTNYELYLKDLPYQDCSNSIILYTFNDKVFPPTLEFISGGGIIGLYTTLVFVASRVLRSFFADQCGKIMFEDLPNVDRVLQLCLDIYLVREACEFALEEDLFAKLVFLFRSPETLIKWTRPKEELADDEDPEDGAGGDH